MSIESRYDSVLKDMFSVLQQALIRYMTSRQVNLNKFQHYFCNFFKKMTTLEEQFHPNQPKFTQNLSKLWEFFKVEDNGNKFSLQPTVTGLNAISKPMNFVQPSLTISQPKTSQPPTRRLHQTLNIIGEEEDEEYLQFERNNQRRSGTAECKRTNRLNASNSFNNSRPKTGGTRSKDRYNNRTISYNNRKQANKRTGQSLNLDTNYEVQPPRKNFYNELEKQAQAQIIYENKVKIPKRNSISTHRWSFKINKLF